MSFVSDIVGSFVQADSTRKAANIQADAADRATDLQGRIFDQTRADNMPALDARNASLTKLQNLLGIGTDTTAAGFGSMGGKISPTNVQNEAGYQFGMDQGMQALNNQLGARGMRNSGAALKAAARYGTDYGSTKYNEAFNREVANRNAVLNPLQSVAGLGQSGANSIAAAGSNYANAAGNNMLGAANAQAASGIAQGNAISSGLNALGGWYQNTYGNPFSNWGNTAGVSGNNDGGGGNPMDWFMQFGGGGD